MWAEPLDPFAQVFQPEGQKRRKISSSSPCSSDGFSEGSLALSTISPAPVDFDDGLSIDSYSTSEVNDQSEYTIPYASLQPSLYLTHLTPLETHYLQYHIEQGSKLLVNLETTENPLRSLIIPRALSSPLLMKAMCALSAMHFSNRSFDSFGVSIDAQTAATKYYIQTMKGIRMALAEDSGGGVSDEVVLAVGLLCKYEIVRGSVRQWAVHLGALQRLVISRGGYASLDRDTAEFLCGLYVFQCLDVWNYGLMRTVLHMRIMWPNLPTGDISQVSCRKLIVCGSENWTSTSAIRRIYLSSALEPPISHL